MNMVFWWIPQKMEQRRWRKKNVQKERKISSIFYKYIDGLGSVGDIVSTWRGC